jgi:hypothetical protein
MDGTLTEVGSQIILTNQVLIPNLIEDGSVEDGTLEWDGLVAPAIVGNPQQI